MGALHRYHPDPERGDPVQAVLYDGCERCAEHAERPFVDLDDRNLKLLWDLMLRVEVDETYPDHYGNCTQTEMEACRVLYEHYRHSQRLIRAHWVVDEK